MLPWDSQVALVAKNPPANAGEHKRHGFDPWVGKVPWRRKWQPTPVFLRGKFHGQRSLASCSPWSRKGSDMHTASGNSLKVKVKLTQSCQILCNSMDYTVHGIFQARILEWIAFPFSRGSSQPKDWTQVSHIAGGFFTSWATRETQEYWSG